MPSDNLLLECSIKVGDVNKLKYDRVTRIEAINESIPEMRMFLDVNTELYPVEKGDHINMALVLSLNIDGEQEAEKGWRAVTRGETTMADEYDYVCHGKIYRFDEGEGPNIKVYISFGGLLMYIDGPYSALAALRVDHVYLMMRK